MITHVTDGAWISVVAGESVLHVLVDASSLGVALGEFALGVLAGIVSDALSALAPRLHGALVVVVAEAVVRQLRENAFVGAGVAESGLAGDVLAVVVRYAAVFFSLENASPVLAFAHVAEIGAAVPVDVASLEDGGEEDADEGDGRYAP